ncbi:hypothetical protein ACFTZI_05270 [Streptomyces decoyicus]
MVIDVQIAPASNSFLAVLTVLFAVALTHPDPQIRGRAERLLVAIFRAR